LKLLNLQKGAGLVIDNALSHPDEDARSTGDIIVIFLLPNVTELCLPMDKSVHKTSQKKVRSKAFAYAHRGSR
jgi:hypothetical protein